MKHALGILLFAACAGLSHAKPTANSFANDPAVIEFALDLERRHGFNANELLQQFAQVRSNDTVLRLIKPPTSPTQRSWERYRSRFLNEQRIERGVRFWQENQVSLIKASVLYGVPPEIIVAIIGVETEYGANTGNFRVLEALATLAFNYPRRAEFFRTELEQFLLLARENGMDPLSMRGSFAGAIGIPQFMPGSQRRYAVDFDNDQKIDLASSFDDAIGSVARFLEQHGWLAEQPVAVPAQTRGEPERSLIEAGIQPTLLVADLAQAGITANADAQATVTLVDLVSPGRPTEYWLGHNNFYVITRYNRSSFYAMSVFQLAEAIRGRMPRD